MGSGLVGGNVPPERNVDTSQKTVKTYVPAYQKETWQEHAARLGMNQSEFIRTMVQAGRRDFSLQNVDQTESTQVNQSADETEERIADVLSNGGCLSWDSLLEHLMEDVEADLEAAIDSLQEQNRIKYSGKNGGYTLVER